MVLWIFVLDIFSSAAAFRDVFSGGVTSAEAFVYARDQHCGARMNPDDGEAAFVSRVVL